MSTEDDNPVLVVIAAVMVAMLFVVAVIAFVSAINSNIKYGDQKREDIAVCKALGGTPMFNDGDHKPVVCVKNPERIKLP